MSAGVTCGTHSVNLRFMTPEDGTEISLRCYHYSLRNNQNSAVLIYLAAEA
jgi:hypothetical protein